MRLPTEELVSFLPQILEGILLWAEDSKNKFRAKVRGEWEEGRSWPACSSFLRQFCLVAQFGLGFRVAQPPSTYPALQVRVIVERLARKCGFEEVERHIPEAHRRLFSHIRKQANRQERAKSMAGSQV